MNVEPDYIGMLRRHARMIVLLCVSAVVQVFLFTFLLNDKYQASTLVLITPQSETALTTSTGGKELLSFPVSAIGVSTQTETSTKTYGELIKSRPVIEQVVRELQLDRPAEEDDSLLGGLKDGFKELVARTWQILQYGRVVEGNDFDEAASELSSRISITPTRNSYVFSIECLWPNPQVAAAAANEIASAFVELLNEISESEARGLREFLDGRLEESETQVANARAELRAFKEEHKTIAFSEETAEQIKLVAELEGELETTTSRLSGQLAQFHATGRPTTPQARALAAERNRLAEGITSRKAALADLPDAEAQLASLTLELRIAEQIHELISREHEEARIREAKQTSDIRIVSPALVPVRPVRPIKISYAIVAGMIALLAGTGLALLLEIINPRLCRVEDVERVLEAPVLATLPNLARPTGSGRGTSGGAKALAVAALLLGSGGLVLGSGATGGDDDASVREAVQAPGPAKAGPRPGDGPAADSFAGLQQQIDAWIAAGGNPAEVFALGTELDALLARGSPEQVEAQIQRIRALVSTVPAPLPPASAAPVPVHVRPIPAHAEIAFHSARSGIGPEVYTMGERGGDVAQITFLNPQPYDQPYEHVAVSFDHRWIAADRYIRGGAGPTGVWLIDLEQGRETRLAPDFFSAGHGGVDWSPDGQLYFAGRASVADKTGIYRIRPEGSAPEALFVLDASDPGYVGDVSVSDDGSMLAYVRAVAPDPDAPNLLKTEVWVARSDGSGRRMVDDGGPELGSQGGFPIGDFDPELSPDNAHVVFSRTNTQHVNYRDSFATAHDLWVAPVDGSTPARRLTRPGPISIVPDWKDGRILFTEIDEADGYAGLALIRPDGTGYRRIGPPSTSLRDAGTAGKWIPRSALQEG